MKSILYVGATLMIGASIYGFIDYQKTSRKKEFSNMYKEKEVSKPETVAVQKTTDPAESKQIAVKGSEKTVATVVSSKENNTVKVVKPKKRKFRFQEFSRAPLDERYIKEDIKLDMPKTKTESGKIVRKDSFGENKEQ